jgi:hypothetical protein
MPHNVVATKGIERLAAILLTDTLYIAVGTGTTTPTAGDIALVTETGRVTPSNTFQTGSIAQVRAFFTNAQLPATAEEFGVFMNASGAADSGELLFRTLLTFVKGSSDLALIFEFTLEAQQDPT